MELRVIRRFTRPIATVVACLLAIAGLGAVATPVGRASDVEGIYNLSATNASGDVGPISAVNSFQVFINPAATTTQFQVSFDTGTVMYSLNGSSGSLTSGVRSSPLAVPIGESDLVLTYTNSLSEQTTYHVYLKRSVLITNMWFEGTTVSSPTNFDASTTVTVPLSPVWDADATGYTGFSVSVPHGVVMGRVVWTYSRVGEQNVSGYSVDYDAPQGARATNFVYDSVAQTGTATSGWGTLGVGSNRYLVFTGTNFVGGGGAGATYAVYATRGPALSADAVSDLALNDTTVSLGATSELYTWQAFMPATATSTHVNATFASGSASWSVNGQSGSLTSGVDSAAIAVPIGQSDVSITYTPVTGPPIVYHVLIKRSILITNMWFEGTTVSSPTNFDASTTVTVPLSPVWDADATGYTGFSVSVPHGVVMGRVVWTYSRVGEQNVSGYSVDYDAPQGARATNFVYDSVAQTGTATSGWGTLGVGSNRYLVFTGTNFVGGGGAGATYAVYATRGPALSADAVSDLALNDTTVSLGATSELYTWQAFMPATATSTHVNATFASGSASWSVNGQSGSLTSGVDSAAIAVPIGQSDVSITYTPVTGPPIVYHVLIKRSILITNMWFEGTTVSSPTNFDASTTVTVPLSPVWDADATGYTGFSVSVPHGVVMGRVVWTYSRVGEQNVSGYSVDYDAPQGARATNFVYDSVAQTGTATSGWGTLDVGSNRYLVFTGTNFVGGGGAGATYAVYATRRAATVVPGPPLVREAAPVDTTSALVTWDPPTSDGGETIESYTVTASQVSTPKLGSARSGNRSAQSVSVADVAPGTCVTTTTSCVVTGLTTGATYTFAVTAKNVNGDGPSSVATSAVTILVAPNAPTAVEAVAGNASAVVSWTAPVVDGGSAITGYTATSTPGGFTCQTQSASSLTCEIAGLSNGTSYTFAVVAHNQVGGSEASVASSSVTPNAPSSTVPDPTTTSPDAPSSTVPDPTTTSPDAPSSTVPAPSESVILDLPQPAQPLLADTVLVVGETVSLEFDGFVPGEFVQLIVASTPQVIATGYADSAGRIRLSGSLPAGLANGQHSLALYAPVSGRGVRQPITIEQAALPATGSGKGLPLQLVVAGLMLVLGLGFSMRSGRRRPLSSVRRLR